MPLHVLSGRLAGTLFAAAALAAAQVPPPSATSADSPAATLAESVTVNVVNIDVHVTNRRGEPIADLVAADFEIFEDGELVEITNFLNASARDGMEWTEGDELEEPGGADAPLMVALYVDRYRTSHGNLLRIEGDLASFLSDRRDQGGGIRFLLATGDPELNVRVPFTDDPQELLGALEQLRDEPRSGLHDDELLRRRIIGEVRRTYETCAQPPSSPNNPGCFPCIDTWSALLGSAGHYAAEMQSRVSTSTSALGELMTALGGLPGPKALIYVSDGLPQRPGAEMYHYLGQICPDRQSETDSLEREWDDTTRFNRLSAFSNANRVTIYPVDAGGVRASSAADPSFAGPVGGLDGAGFADSRLSAVLVPSRENDRVRVDNLQATLSLLADETGGQAVFNQARPAEALEEIAADFGSYYSLGYGAPPDPRQPIRQIDVRLTKPGKGRQVRYRRSYILKSQDQRLADRLFAALKLDEQSNPLAAEVTFGDPAPATDSNVSTLPVEVQLPVSAVTLLPGAAGQNGAVRIFLIAESEDGRRTPMRQKTLTLSEDQLQAEREHAVVVVNVDLPPGAFAVAVGIRDEASGRSSYLVRDIELPRINDSAR